MIVTNQKQSKCPSVLRHITKMWYNHTMKCYAALKMNKFLPHATVLMNLTSLILKGRNQAQSKAYCVILFI